MFTVSGKVNTGATAGTIDGKEYATPLKMESSTSVSVTVTAKVKMTLYFDATPSVKIDDVSTKNNVLQDAGAVVSGNNLSIEIDSGSHSITKQDTINLYLIKLEPIE